jgi:hypothetical protein
MIYQQLTENREFYKRLIKIVVGGTIQVRNGLSASDVVDVPCGRLSLMP